MNNPFLQPYHTLHDTTPFQQIRIEDYEPAVREGMRLEDEEIQQITGNPEEPTFQNTILALEHAGKALDRVTTVLFNLLSAETCDALEEIAEKLTPALSEHANNISLNEQLFARVKAVYDKRESLQLTPEERRLLEKSYDGFVRNGANLSEEDKATFRKLSMELSSLTLKFSQNHLKETNGYELVLHTEDELAGLPESAIEAAAHTAHEKGKEGCWVITLQAPSYVPFMKYSDKRELRKTLYMAYNTQCCHDNEFNNLKIVEQLVNLRMELAQLLGFKNYAEYVLKKRMAENSENVWGSVIPYLRGVKEESSTYLMTPWKKTMTMASFTKSLENAGYKIGDLKSIKLSHLKKGEANHSSDRGISGRVKSVVFVGKKGRATVSGERLQRLYGLDSTLFDISAKGKELTITGYGYGHGLGLSQWGAEAMAEKHGDGKNYYKTILSHYFTGTKIEKIY